MSLLLTRTELSDLTGCKRRSNVADWLVKAGWAHAVGADGWPRVSRTYAEQRLAGNAKAVPVAANGPNLDWLKKAS